jgi:gliding motility-associated-like protein
MTVTVNQSPTLVLIAGNNVQSVCEDKAITNISYTFGGSSTGATVLGLPSGITSSVNGNTITISGIPNAATFAALPFTVTTSGGNCGTATASGSITVYPIPVVSAGPDRQVELGKTVVLNGTAGGSNNVILWTPPTGLSSANTLTPVASITQTTTYTLLVTSQFGCSGTDDVVVTLLKPLDIPNVFSPNGDGIHDRWVIGNIEMYQGAVVQIFNRYGTMLLERYAYNASNAWDGTHNGNPLPVGAYYYIIQLVNGKKIGGVVSILR